MKLTIVADGACKGNPGKSGAGVVIKLDGETVTSIDEYLGWQTNNEAEWRAALIGLRAAMALEKWDQVTSVELRTDSQIVVNQASGRWACKSITLQPFLRQWGELVKRCRKPVRATWTQDVGLAHHLADQASTRYGRK